jgi:preprotein translocase subunit SecF
MSTENKTNRSNKGINDPGRFAFMKVAPMFSIVSLALVALSCVIIISQGFRYGIDFAGGTEVQVQFASKPPIGEIRSFLETIVGSVMVQTLGDDNEVLIRMQMAEGETEKEVNEKNNERIQSVTSGILQQFSLGQDSIRQVNSVGPQIGAELKTKGLLAVIYSLIMILIYVGLRFDYKYAPGAVICLFHDAVITLGIFSILGKEVNVQILAAILTIIGYSLNDTIVNFDRIRENEVIYKGKDLGFIINRSINDVLSRTLLTSITTILAVAALYSFAGGVIEDLAFTLGIGVVVGTYSSIYVASPLVILTDKLSKQWGLV